MKSLIEIYNELKAQGHESDKGSVHSYIEVYEALLLPYRQTAKNVLEIGLLNGASLRMWERYFNCNVYGIDCDLKPIGGMANLQPMIDEGTHKIIIGDAEDPAVIEQHFRGIKFDVAVEDANHSLEQQFNIFRNLRPYLNDNAIYIIEDFQNLDKDRAFLEAWGDACFISNRNLKIIDRRHILGRYDDVLIVIK